MKKVLVTCFNPFGGDEINPSEIIVHKLPTLIKGHLIIPFTLETAFYVSLEQLLDKVNDVKPDIVISVGLAGGREKITVERVAINLADARIPDNLGEEPIDEPILENEPSAYFSTLPIKAMVKASNDKFIPAEISNTAGTFVCNFVMYGMLHYVATVNPKIKAGFIHIPNLLTQTKTSFSMKEEDILEGLISMIEAAILYETDLKITGGREH